MRIIWHVDDGYVNPGSHELEIDDDELEDYPEGHKRDDFIRSCVQREFNNTVRFYYHTEED